MLQRYKPNIHVKFVCWQPPQLGWVKCSSDGASKGNPGRCFYRYCVRNHLRDLVYAALDYIGIVTDMTAEARAVNKGLRYCHITLLSIYRSGGGFFKLSKHSN